MEIHHVHGLGSSGFLTYQCSPNRSIITVESPEVCFVVFFFFLRTLRSPADALVDGPSVGSQVGQKEQLRAPPSASLPTGTSFPEGGASAGGTGRPTCTLQEDGVRENYSRCGSSEGARRGWWGAPPRCGCLWDTGSSSPCGKSPLRLFHDFPVSSAFGAKTVDCVVKGHLL